VYRANLDGTGLTPVLSGLNRPSLVVLDLAGGKMYYSGIDNGNIERRNLDGTGGEILVRGLNNPGFGALDLAGGKMYWDNGIFSFNGGDYRRANLDGTEQQTLVQNLSRPGPLALDVAHGQMYWSDFGSGDIQRANLDGTGQQFLITGLPGPFAVALDLGTPGTAVFYALAAPASVPAGTAFDLTITAADPYGNIDVNYQGTVTFSTSDTDPGIVLPSDYTFTADDRGVHTLPGAVTLSTPGDQTITGTDTASGITRTVTVTVVTPN
jgi:hypothetical protein